MKAIVGLALMSLVTSIPLRGVPCDANSPSLEGGPAPPPTTDGGNGKDTGFEPVPKSDLAVNLVDGGPSTTSTGTGTGNGNGADAHVGGLEAVPKSDQAINLVEGGPSTTSTGTGTGNGNGASVSNAKAVNFVEGPGSKPDPPPTPSDPSVGQGESFGAEYSTPKSEGGLADDPKPVPAEESAKPEVEEAQALVDGGPPSKTEPPASDGSLKAEVKDAQTLVDGGPRDTATEPAKKPTDTADGRLKAEVKDAQALVAGGPAKTEPPPMPTDASETAKAALEEQAADLSPQLLAQVDGGPPKDPTTPGAEGKGLNPEGPEPQSSRG